MTIIVKVRARPRKKTTSKASIEFRLLKISPAVLTMVAETTIILIASALFK